MTEKWPQLRNAPIVEGLLDIQFVPMSANRLADLESFQTHLPEYSRRSPKVAFAGEIAFSAMGGRANISHESEVIGYQFATTDGRRVFQLRLNGATLSFLGPYSRFDDLSREAKRLWDLVIDVIKPGDITRVALRYINRLVLPLPFDDFREYLSTVPDLAVGLPQNLTAYQMRLFIPDNQTPSQSIVTQAFDGVEPGSSELVVFLDIDVFQSANESDRIMPESLWDIVAQLRDYKNRLFFGTITDKLRSIIE